MISSPSLNYTQGYSHQNSYKTSGSRSSYGHGGGRGDFSNRGAGRGGGDSNRGRGGGQFANFQCQICLKYGHIANVCHFRFDMNFQPHESLIFFDPTTFQPIPYSIGSARASNTWINPNSKAAIPDPSQPSVMLTNSSSHGSGPAGSTWIPNSGASFHVTGESHNIKQFTHFDGPDQIFIGNGESLSISSVGYSSFVSPNDVGITFNLYKLIHVPSILKNLLSESVC